MGTDGWVARTRDGGSTWSEAQVAPGRILAGVAVAGRRVWCRRSARDSADEHGRGDRVPVDRLRETGIPGRHSTPEPAGIHRGREGTHPGKPRRRGFVAPRYLTHHDRLVLHIRASGGWCLGWWRQVDHPADDILTKSPLPQTLNATRKVARAGTPRATPAKPGEAVECILSASRRETRGAIAQAPSPRGAGRTVGAR